LKYGASSLLLREWADDELEKRNEILYNLLRTSAKPNIVVRYSRKAFVSGSNNLRVNLDSNLEACQWMDCEYNNFVTVNKGGVIMEVKYSFVLPHWIGDLIKKYNLKRITFSKYARSIEALRKFNPLPR